MTPREAALAALERCRRDKAWSNASIDSVISKYALDKRDGALAARLCLGVLQNSTLCDFYIDSFCGKKLEPRVRDILRMGVYQLLFLEKIPSHAAVNESVTLCTRAGVSRASGLVNAVLRRLATAEALPEIPGKGTAAYLSVRYSHPLWLAEKLTGEHGYDYTESFFASNNTPPGTDIQVNTLKVSAADYERALIRTGRDYRRFDALPGCIELSGGSVTELPGFEDGLFYVQDRAARTAAEIAGARPGMSILDACAAPGGKSFACALAMENSGSILACDIHEKKLQRIESGAKRLGISVIETMTADARADDAAMHDRFDVVLADVPCSGMGVIRKKPEIRLKSEKETAALPTVQRDILRNLSSFVRPGGVLLYSTCTVLREENEDVVSDFLSEHKNYTPVPFTAGGITSDSGLYTFWPHVDGTDGFFTAKLKRVY